MAHQYRSFDESGFETAELKEAREKYEKIRDEVTKLVRKGAHAGEIAKARDAKRDAAHAMNIAREEAEKEYYAEPLAIMAQQAAENQKLREEEQKKAKAGGGKR